MALLRTGLTLLTGLLIVSGGARAEPPEDKPNRRIDHYGDPLPWRAVSRLGTTRLLHADFVTASVFSPDGRRFASSAIDGSLIIWEWPSGKSLRTFSFQSRDFPCLLFAPEGRYFVAYADKGLVVWDLTSGQAIVKVDATHKPAFSPDGKKLAWLKDAQTICVRDLGASKDPVIYSRKHKVLALGYDPEGCLVIAEDNGASVSLRDLETDKQFHEVEIQGDPLLWADFTPDASRFAFQTKKAGVTVLRVRTGKGLYRLAALPEGCSPSVLGNDGKTLLLQSRKSGTIQHWDLVCGVMVIRAPNRHELSVGRKCPEASAKRFLRGTANLPILIGRRLRQRRNRPPISQVTKSLCSHASYP
jgi:WD40 repeat protein